MNRFTDLPLVQGSQVLFLLLLSITALRAQHATWELGVGLSPLQLQEEPASLLLRYHWSDRFALRVGLGVNYSEQSEDHSYLHPYADTIYDLSYEYLQVDKRLNARLMLGLQYGKKRSDFYWYGATDLYFRYKYEKPELPESVRYSGSTLIPPGEVLIVFDGARIRAVGLGARQSVGLQYFITRFVSLAVEGGIHYEWLKVQREPRRIFVSRSETPGEYGVGYGGYTQWPINEENYVMSGSPITFLIFSYYFR